MPCILLLLLDLQGTQVLLELSLVDSVLVFQIFERYLPSLFELGLLVQILEKQMLQTLFPDFDRDLVLLLEILELALLVPILCLLVFELFLAHEPEVVDSETLVVIKTCEIFLPLDGLFQLTTLKPQRSLVLFVVVVVDSVGSLEGLLLSGELSSTLLCVSAFRGGLFRRHFFEIDLKLI